MTIKSNELQKKKKKSDEGQNLAGVRAAALYCLPCCLLSPHATSPFPVAGSLIEFSPVFTVQSPLFVTTLIKAQLQQRVFFIYHVY